MRGRARYVGPPWDSVGLNDALERQRIGLIAKFETDESFAVRHSRRRRLHHAANHRRRRQLSVDHIEQHLERTRRTLDLFLVRLVDILARRLAEIELRRW